MATDLTRENCETATEFYHKTDTAKKGDRIKYRRNWKTKTWKTRQNEFEIPVKHGLYDYGYITHKNCRYFTID